jgi:hypothetical protein
MGRTRVSVNFPLGRKERHVDASRVLGCRGGAERVWLFKFERTGNLRPSCTTRHLERHGNGPGAIPFLSSGARGMPDPWSLHRSPGSKWRGDRDIGGGAVGRSVLSGAMRAHILAGNHTDGQALMCRSARRFRPARGRRLLPRIHRLRRRYVHLQLQDQLGQERLSGRGAPESVGPPSYLRRRASVACCRVARARMG